MSLKATSLIAIVSLIGVQAIFAADLERIQVPSSKTFDQQAFSYEIVSAKPAESFKILALRYPSPFQTPYENNNTIHAEYYLPNACEQDKTPRPAFICLHILNGNFEIARTFCVNFASRGIPALMMMLPYYGPRRPANHNKIMRSEQAADYFLDAAEQAMLDLRRTFDLLASRPEIDPNKIGVLGVSLGGITAARALGREPRFYKGVLMLAGGDLPNLIGHSKESRFVERIFKKGKGQEQAALLDKLKSIDPIATADKLKSRAKAGKIMMINAENDEVMPRRCTTKLAEAMGLTEKDIHWIKGAGHYSSAVALPAMLKKVADFALADLPSNAGQVTPKQGKTSTPWLAFQTKLAKTLSLMPPPDKMIILNLSFSVKDPHGKTHKGNLNLSKGNGCQFKIDAMVPLLKKRLLLGYADAPWLTSLNGTVFMGSENVVEDETPFSHVNPKYAGYIEMIRGMCGMLATSPSFAERFINVKTSGEKNGVTSYEISDKANRHHIRLSVDDDGTPTKPIEFDVAKHTGTLTIKDWRVEAPERIEAFSPTKPSNVKAVDQHRLNRIFAALVNQIGYMVK